VRNYIFIQQLFHKIDMIIPIISQKISVTPRLLQKGESENFNFHVTLRHHRSYKLIAKYFFFNNNTSELLTKIHQNI